MKEKILNGVKAFKYNKYTLGDNVYEKKNLILINDIFSSEHKSNLIINTGGEIMEANSLVSTALKIYLHNAVNEDNNILNIIDEGDIVVYKGNKVSYKGIKNISNEERIALEYKNGSLTYILKEKSYELTVYNGDGNTLSAMNSKEKKRKDITKELISAITGIEREKITGSIVDSAVVVMPNISYIDEMVNNIYLIKGNERYTFSAVFPCAYYSNSENYKDYPGNLAKLKHLIKFTTKLSTARELIHYDRNIKYLIVFGEELYRNDLNELELLMKRKSLDTCIIFNDWSSVNHINDIVENNEVKLFSWSKNALLDNINLHEYKEELMNKRCNHIWRRVGNIVEKKIELMKVDIDENTAGLMKKVRKQIKSFDIKNTFNDANLTFFIRDASYLINTFENIFMPIRTMEEIIGEFRLSVNKPKDILTKLDNILKNFNNNYGEYELMNSIVDNLNLLYLELYLKNNKYDYIFRYLTRNRNKKIAVVTKGRGEREVIKKLLYKLNLSCGIYTVNNFPKNKTFDEVILNGVTYFGRYNYYFDNSAPLVSNLVYNFHERIFKRINKRNIMLAEKLDIHNELVESDEKVQTHEAVEIENEEKIKEEFDIVSDTINLSIDNLLYSLNKNFVEYHGNGQPMIAERLVLFTLGDYAFLSKYYKASVLDRNKSDIILKDCTSISKGDELVFVRTDELGNNDIVDNVIEKLMHRENFSREHRKSLELSMYWKGLFKNYVADNNMTYVQFSNLLSENSSENISPAAVSSWFNSNVIGPRNIYVFEAAAKFIDDQFFKENYSEVFEACRRIRSMHTKISRALGKIIISSAVNSDYRGNDELEKLIISSIGDVHEYVQIVEVHEVEKLKKEVPVSMINKLIFNEE